MNSTNLHHSPFLGEAESSIPLITGWFPWQPVPMLKLSRSPSHLSAHTQKNISGYSKGFRCCGAGNGSRDQITLTVPHLPLPSRLTPFLTTSLYFLLPAPGPSATLLSLKTPCKLPLYGLALAIPVPGRHVPWHPQGSPQLPSWWLCSKTTF